MKNCSTLLAGFALIASAHLASAQAQGQQPAETSPAGQATSQKGEDEVQEEIDKSRKFFQVSLSDGGSYMVALSRITSIAKHEYIVDGAVRVNEVSITAEGATITRFYYLEEVDRKSPSSAGQVVIDRVRGATKEIAKRTGTEDLLNTVSKSYPDGTHTHNVEYRLRNKANVNQLYNSLHDAWYNGVGKRVTLKVKK